ncbi:hypothetical protein [Roseobacter sp. SK209-2-6]|uniref:hypothetical protein n=1 Tax=Roseobacter sp. SK209-2-6 TaxID=388739 RepID=UPI001E4137C5|nr:hypothetical protein [Roseobacter sp. SK209-2-6]
MGRNMASMVKILSVSMLCAGLLAACGPSKEDRLRFDGIPFKAKAKVVDKKVSRAHFRVEVYDAPLSLEGARLAAHHSGVSYCLTEAGYGTSKIDWDIDPFDPEAALALDGTTAVFHGTCAP